MEIETEIEECMNDMIKKIQQKEYDRRWYQKNKEKKIRNAIKWKKNNPDKVRGYDKKHRKTPKGKATEKKSKAKYIKSEKGKENRKAWWHKQRIETYKRRGTLLYSHSKGWYIPG